MEIKQRYLDSPYNFVLHSRHRFTQRNSESAVGKRIRDVVSRWQDPSWVGGRRGAFKNVFCNSTMWRAGRIDFEGRKEENAVEVGTGNW